KPEGGVISECKFEYGPTISYGSSVPCASPPSGEGILPIAVSATLTGLSANTPLHFRISATNSTGTSKSSDQGLRTLPEPPTVVRSAASSIHQSAATLNATVNPNGGEVSECKFEYGETESYGKAVPCTSLPGSGESSVAVSATPAELTPNATYDFRIVAKNAG